MVKMKKVLFSFFLVFLAFFISSAAAQENITITTFYPSPFGVYRNLETQTIRILNSNEEVSIGLDGNNPAIELRDRDAGGRTPYIDFSNDAVSNFDMRIILNGNNELRVQGGNLRVLGNVVANNLPGCQRRTFTAATGVQQCPVGFAVSLAPLAPISTSGSFLCCAY